MAGGYPCFLVSLAMIGLIVIVVGDLAGIFGCLVGLKDEVETPLETSLVQSHWKRIIEALL